MSDAAHRILARFRQGALVSDPAGALRKLRQELDRWDEHILDAHKIQDILGELNKLKARDQLTPETQASLNRDLSALSKPLLSIEVFIKRFYIDRFNGMWLIALTLLQKYSLPTPLRKKVEGISRFWATKQKPRAPRLPRGSGTERTLAVVTYYLKYIEDTQDQLAVLTEAMTKGRPIAEGTANDAAKIKAGPFTLVNTGGFSDDVMQSVAAVCKKAADYAAMSGVGEVCYGEVNVTQKISKGNFYMIENDELFVRADANTSERHLHTLLHELGHRYEHKFIKYQGCIATMFMLIGSKHREEMGKREPHRGDPFVSKGEEFTVDYVVENKVHLVPKIDPDKVRDQTREKILRKNPGRNESDLKAVIDYTAEAEIQTLHKTKATISLEGYYQTMGIDARAEVDFRGFITPYAGKDQSENFAEMFGFYCTGDLPPAQAALFEQQVFSATPQRPDFSTW